MKLALYSSALHNPNPIIDEAVYKMLPKNCDQHFSIIMQGSDSRPYVDPIFSTYLAPFVHATYSYVDLENDAIESVLQKLNESTLIFFSGGNTFQFLQNLRTYDMIQTVTDLAKRDTVFVGSSAGAILMTPTIDIANYPSFDADENAIGLTDFAALNWVKFEITPHYQGTDDEIKEFRKYSLTNGRPVYAVADTTAILVDGVKQQLFGNIVMFDSGELVKVQCAC